MCHYVTIVIYICFSGTEIDLVRAKVNADEQMCWYLTTFTSYFKIVPLSAVSLIG